MTTTTIELPKNINKKKIFDQYEFYQNAYQQKYGNKTIVLMQVGGFYELYGVDNENTKIGKVKEIANLLHIECTRKNKENKENSRENHLMAGFPLAALSKYIDILMENNYTAVIVEQEGTAKDKVKANDKLPRKVVEIYSPGTFFSSNGMNEEHKYLVQIHLEGYQKTRKLSNIKCNYQPMIIGLSAIDVTTGESDVYEVSNSLSDNNYAMDEIYRYLQTHQPKELILTSNNLDMSREELESYLDLQTISCQINYNQVSKEYYKLSYQQQFLEKIFPNRNNMLSVIEYLNLERTPSALISYLSLLQFTYEHNELLIHNLKNPSIWNSNQHLLLANNTISQLDLSNQNKNRTGSILNLLNMTSTSMGRRLFKERLLNPILDTDQIEYRYKKIDIFRKNNFWEIIEKHLEGIVDLDRSHRKIELGMMSPNSFNMLHSSYKQIIDLLNMLPSELLQISEKQISEKQDEKDESEVSFNDPMTLSKKFIEYVNDLEKILDFEELYKYVAVDKIIDNIFKSGYDTELDGISQEIRMNNRYLEIMMTKMSKLITGANGSSVVTLKNTDASGYYFMITANRYNDLIKILKTKDQEKKSETFMINQKEFIFTADTFRVNRKNKDDTSFNITCGYLEEISEHLTECINNLQKRVKIVYYKFMNDLMIKYKTLYEQLTNLIADLDVCKSCAKSSIKFNYCRPQVIKHDSSFMQVINFRHPLVERLNQNSYYVPHSIQLGQLPPILSDESFPDTLNNSLPDKPNNLLSPLDGMLLYGLNSSGKSTCMKAIGVNLVLAQAGMFVPAESFIYAPYKRVLTRILGNDNIFKGLSSFAVEMSELRGILARADENSLVLGDEICHGTETISGVSIVSASILKLSDLGAHFIFASHLHQLTEIEDIQGLINHTDNESDKPNIGVYHLHVEYDPQSHRLIYYRDLRKGSGNPMYGIEVARAMDLDNDFLSTANRIRQKIMGQNEHLLALRKSRYNDNVYMDKCLVCNGKPDDTHHIKFQCQADENGFIGATHKHEMKNLVPLCKKCHMAIDTNELVIRGYIETSEGRKLDFDNNQSNDSKPESKNEPNMSKIVFKRSK